MSKRRKDNSSLKEKIPKGVVEIIFFMSILFLFLFSIGFYIFNDTPLVVNRLFPFSFPFAIDDLIGLCCRLKPRNPIGQVNRREREGSQEHTQ